MLKRNTNDGLRNWHIFNFFEMPALVKRLRHDHILVGGGQTDPLLDSNFAACSVASVVSSSLWPYGPQPTRLLCLCNSPVKYQNHIYPQEMKTHVH